MIVPSSAVETMGLGGMAGMAALDRRTRDAEGAPEGE
jgi:hypothetical protein